MHRPIAATLTLGTVLLTGCGGPPARARTPTEPATDRSLAAAIIDHVGGRPSRASALFEDDDERRGAVVDFRGDQSLSVSIVVERKPGAAPTCGDHDDCETTQVAERDVLLAWDRAVPGENEGGWFVRTRLGSTLVTVRADGPAIEGDPRSGHLAEITDALRDVVADPAVGYRTSPGYVRAGRAITDKVWSGVGGTRS